MTFSFPSCLTYTSNVSSLICFRKIRLFNETKKQDNENLKRKVRSNNLIGL